MKTAFRLKRRVSLLALVALFALSACGGDKAPVSSQTTPTVAAAATATPTSKAVDVKIDNSLTTVGVIMQEYDDYNAVEILMIQYDGQQPAFTEYGGKNPEIEMLNNEIEAGPLKIYHDFKGGGIGDSINIHSYPFVDDEYVQIITACIVYPKTQEAVNSKLWTYNFRKSENKIISVDDMLKEYRLTRDDVTAKFNELYEKNYLGDAILSVDVTGFRIIEGGEKPVAFFFIEVMMDTAPDPIKCFFAYAPDTEQVAEFNPLWLYEASEPGLTAMDPPLTCQWAGAQEDMTTDCMLQMDTTGFDELTPNCEYMADGMLYITLETYPLLSDEAYDEDEMLSRIMALEGDDIRPFTVTLSDEHSERLSYPTWLIVYETGYNEDSAVCTDIYFQTDTGEYRAHTKVSLDYAQDYHDEIGYRLSSVILVDANE